MHPGTAPTPRTFGPQGRGARRLIVMVSYAAMDLRTRLIDAAMTRDSGVAERDARWPCWGAASEARRVTLGALGYDVAGSWTRMLDLAVTPHIAVDGMSGQPRQAAQDASRAVFHPQLLRRNLQAPGCVIEAVFGWIKTHSVPWPRFSAPGPIGWDSCSHSPGPPTTGRQAAQTGRRAAESDVVKMRRHEDSRRDALASNRRNRAGHGRGSRRYASIRSRVASFSAAC